MGFFVFLCITAACFYGYRRYKDKKRSKKLVYANFKTPASKPTSEQIKTSKNNYVAPLQTTTPPTSSSTIEQAVRDSIAKYLGIPEGVALSDVTITIVNDQPPPLPQKYIFNPTAGNRKCIQALVFIAKADGQFREEEAQVIARLLCKLQPEHSESQNIYLVDQIKKLPKIGYAEYKNLVNSMTSKQLIEFIKQAQIIIGTQEKVHPFEEVLLDNLKDRFKILNEVNI